MIKPTIDAIGATDDPIGPIPYGSRARADRGLTVRVM
jgi:hypothetical protein